MLLPDELMSCLRIIEENYNIEFALPGVQASWGARFPSCWETCNQVILDHVDAISLDMLSLLSEIDLFRLEVPSLSCHVVNAHGHECTPGRMLVAVDYHPMTELLVTAVVKYVPGVSCRP